MKSIKVAALAALIGLGVSQARADQTNLVQNLDVALVGVQSGGTVTNHNSVITGFTQVSLGTRDVINALGASTGNPFTKHAHLVSVTPLGGEGFSFIQVRDGGLTVDVTSFFVHQQLTGSVSGTVSSTARPRSVSLNYSIQQLALQDASGYAGLTLHFNVSGFATESLSSNSPSQATELDIDASGSGDINGNLVILQGSINLSGGTIEVVVPLGV